MESVGEAVLELLQAGDGSLSSLDVPELEPLDGVLTVSEVAKPLDLEAFEDDDGAGPFAPAADDLLVGRLDEHPFLPGRRRGPRRPQALRAAARPVADCRHRKSARPQ